MMKLALTALLSALLCAGAPAPPTNPAPKSLLWKISGNGLQQPSYLYGTIHLLCKGDLNFSPAVTNAFRHSRQLFLEVNMDDPQLIMKMQQALTMPAGYSFKALFQPDDYQKLQQFFKDSVGFDLAILDQMKPMAVLSVLTQKLVPCREIVSCELELTKLAKAQQKPVKGLESLEDQVAVFDSIPDKEEAAILVKMIDEMPRQRALFRNMIQTYLQQDIDALYEKIQQSPEIGTFQDLLLDKRNASWIPVMRRQMEQAPTFFACGAGHLGGARGVLQLLRDAGYKVEAVH